MKILLLHPETSPVYEPWTQQRWDMIVDLGYAGGATYAEWSRLCKTRVVSIHEYAVDMEGYRWINQVFDSGRGKLLDRMGLDWWDLLSVGSYQGLHALLLFQRLRAEISGTVEIWGVRPHGLVRVAEQVFGACHGYFQRESFFRRTLRVGRSIWNLRPAQVVEIAFDKWDRGYPIRRHWARQSSARLSEQAMLLPSAYSNVTRSELAYAAPLTARRFLLATTRQSAIPDRLPENVTMVPLAAYAMPPTTTLQETTELNRGWLKFGRAMASEHPEFQQGMNAGLWDYFPMHLEQGLRLREAWNHLLDSEPITGVLCGDDLNYHTRLPLLLAQRSGRGAVYCSHGALDCGFLFKTPIADCYLVKGEMERDYLQRVSSIPAEKIVIGAPDEIEKVAGKNHVGEAIVFFSQPYEVDGGRTDQIYREILPHLYSAARSSGRKLIVKLHPFESKRARKKLVDSILRQATTTEVEIVDGMPPEQVLARAWCGITVDSSVAVEGALRNVPFFLCGWLDFAKLGCLPQFARFEVAEVLNSPVEIEQIPQRIADYAPSPMTLKKLSGNINHAQLDEIMFGNRHARSHSSVC